MEKVTNFLKLFVGVFTFFTCHCATGDSVPTPAIPAPAPNAYGPIPAPVPAPVAPSGPPPTPPPPPTIRHDDVYYYIAFSDEMDYASSTAACLEIGGEIATPQNEKANEEAANADRWNAPSQPFPPQMYIGFATTTGDASWDWAHKISDLEFNYTNWAPSQPDEGSNEACAYYIRNDINETYWYDNDCQESLGRICQFPRTREYTKYRGVGPPLTFIDAVDFCASQGRTLTIIHSAIENYFIGRFGGFNWFGLVVSDENGTLEWIDGTPLDQELWDEFFWATEFDHEDFTCIRMTDSQWWRKTNCDVMRDYICQSGGEQYNYVVYSDLMNYDDSVKECISAGGDIAQPRTARENAKVASALVGWEDIRYLLPAEKFYIGLSSEYGESVWRYAAGHVLPKNEYTNWGVPETPTFENKMCTYYAVNLTINETWLINDCEEELGRVCRYPMTSEYWTITDKLIYADALDLCTQGGQKGSGKIPSVHSKIENDFVYIKCLDTRNNKCWIAIGRDDPEGNWTWKDGTEMNFQLFDLEDGRSGRLCARFANDANWRQSDCDDDKNVLCETTSNATILPPVPPSADNYNYVAYSDSMNYSLSVQACLSIGGEIAQPKRFKQNLAAALEGWSLGHASAMTYFGFYSGQNTNHSIINGSSWIWADGKLDSEVLYTYWDTDEGEPNEAFENEACATYKNGESFNYNWYDDNCTEEAARICQYPKTLVYLYTSDKVSYEDALAICRLEDGTHISIHSQIENDFIYSKCKDEACWVGARDVEKNGGYVWSDGAPLDFTNFDEAYLRTPPDQDNGFCLIFTTQGTWTRSHCDELRFYICQSAREAVQSTPSPGPGPSPVPETDQDRGFPWVTVAFAILAVVFVIFSCTIKCVYVRQKKRKSSTPERDIASLNTALLGLLDFAADCYFMVDRWIFYGDAIALWASVFIAFPLILRALMIIYIFNREFNEEEAKIWFTRHSGFATTIVVVSMTHIDAMRICYSNLVSSPAFNAPFSEETKSNVLWLGLPTILMEDVPQLILQIIVLVRGDASPVVWLALATSILSILFGSMRRILYCMVSWKDRGVKQTGGPPSKSSHKNVYVVGANEHGHGLAAKGDAVEMTGGEHRQYLKDAARLTDDKPSHTRPSKDQLEDSQSNVTDEFEESQSSTTDQFEESRSKTNASVSKKSASRKSASGSKKYASGRKNPSGKKKRTESGSEGSRSKSEQGKMYIFKAPNVEQLDHVDI